MSAAELIDQVLEAGGQIAADGSDLVLSAPRPLPPALLDQLKLHKPDIVKALGSPSAPKRRGLDGYGTPPGVAPLGDTVMARQVRAGQPDPLPPLTPAQEARRQRVLAIQARDRTHYAVLVEHPNTDPVIMALATPDGTCDVLIPKYRYDPFAVLAMVEAWEA
jgi:hypothetical protein